MSDSRQRVTADVAAVVKLWMEAEITCEEMIEEINALSSRIVKMRCPTCGGQK